MTSSASKRQLLSELWRVYTAESRNTTQNSTLCACVCVCVPRDEYFRMKVQWKSVSEEQEMRNSLLRGYRSLIG